MMLIEYSGDQELRYIAWFRQQLKAIAVCLNEGLPEACLVLIYSGIDTLGLLAAPASTVNASKHTYQRWCEQYIVPRLHGTENEPVAAVDLYAARCGVLHTSTPLSNLSRNGVAHELSYKLLDHVGVNFMMNTPLKPLTLDINKLAIAFKEGALAFFMDLNQDPTALGAAEGRAQHFLRWAKHVEEPHAPCHSVSDEVV